jgi:hypothetical protein
VREGDRITAAEVVRQFLLVEELGYLLEAEIRLCGMEGRDGPNRHHPLVREIRRMARLADAAEARYHREWA